MVGFGAKGVGHVSTYAQGGGMVLDATQSVERTARCDRWSPPVATLFIVSTSLALWAAIFFVVDLIAG